MVDIIMWDLLWHLECSGESFRETRLLIITIIIIHLECSEESFPETQLLIITTIIIHRD